jgi:acyl carrier protein
LSRTDFAVVIAEAAQVPIDRIESSSRLLEDLGIDSLSLAELVCVLIVDLGMASVDDDVGERDWFEITVGELFREYERGAATPRRGIVIRSPLPR